MGEPNTGSSELPGAGAVAAAVEDVPRSSASVAAAASASSAAGEKSRRSGKKHKAKRKSKEPKTIKKKNKSDKKTRETATTTGADASAGKQKPFLRSPGGSVGLRSPVAGPPTKPPLPPKKWRGVQPPVSGSPDKDVAEKSQMHASGAPSGEGQRHGQRPGHHQRRSRKSLRRLERHHRREGRAEHARQQCQLWEELFTDPDGKRVGIVTPAIQPISVKINQKINMQRLARGKPILVAFDVNIDETTGMGMEHSACVGIRSKEREYQAAKDRISREEKNSRWIVVSAHAESVHSDYATELVGTLLTRCHRATSQYMHEEIALYSAGLSGTGARSDAAPASGAPVPSSPPQKRRNKDYYLHDCGQNITIPRLTPRLPPKRAKRGGGGGGSGNEDEHKTSSSGDIPNEDELRYPAGQLVAPIPELEGFTFMDFPELFTKKMACEAVADGDADSDFSEEADGELCDYYLFSENLQRSASGSTLHLPKNIAKHVAREQICPYYKHYSVSGKTLRGVKYIHTAGRRATESRKSSDASVVSAEPPENALVRVEPAAEPSISVEPPRRPVPTSQNVLLSWGMNVSSERFEKLTPLEDCFFVEDHLDPYYVVLELRSRHGGTNPFAERFLAFTRRVLERCPDLVFQNYPEIVRGVHGRDCQNHAMDFEDHGGRIRMSKLLMRCCLRLIDEEILTPLVKRLVPSRSNLREELDKDEAIPGTVKHKLTMHLMVRPLSYSENHASEAAVVGRGRSGGGAGKKTEISIDFSLAFVKYTF